MQITRLRNTIKFNLSLWEIAKQLGVLRSGANLYKREGSDNYFEEGKHLLGECKGILGEILYAHYCVITGREYEMSTLVDVKAVSKEDFLINGKFKVDVKTSWGDDKLYLVNKHQHDNPKGIDFYAFVHIKGDEFTVEHVPYDEVSTWTQYNFKTRAYGKKIVS